MWPPGLRLFAAEGSEMGARSKLTDCAAAAARRGGRGVAGGRRVEWSMRSPSGMGLGPSARIWRDSLENSSSPVRVGLPELLTPTHSARTRNG